MWQRNLDYKSKGRQKITAAQMKYMRRTAGYTRTDHKTNTHIAKELKLTPILDKLLEYKRNWIQHVNRMPRNGLPRVMKHYSPNDRRNHGRRLKRLLDTWDRNESTSGPTPWQIDDDDDDDDKRLSSFWQCTMYTPSWIQPENGPKKPKRVAESCKSIRYWIESRVKLYVLHYSINRLL